MPPIAAPWPAPLPPSAIAPPAAPTTAPTTAPIAPSLTISVVLSCRPTYAAASWLQASTAAAVGTIVAGAERGPGAGAGSAGTARAAEGVDPLVTAFGPDQSATTAAVTTAVTATSPIPTANSFHGFQLPLLIVSSPSRRPGRRPARARPPATGRGPARGAGRLRGRWPGRSP